MGGIAGLFHPGIAKPVDPLRVQARLGDLSGFLISVLAVAADSENAKYNSSAGRVARRIPHGQTVLDSPTGELSFFHPLMVAAVKHRRL